VTDAISAGGLRLPVKHTRDGTLVVSAGDPDLEPLAFVVNAATTGMLPHLRDAVAAGEDVVIQGLFASRPDPGEGHAAAAAAWRRLTGDEPGEDAYVVGTTFTEGDLLVPRDALLAILDALAAAGHGGSPASETERSGVDAAPPATPAGTADAGGVDSATLDALERRAAELDARSVAPPESEDAAGAVSAARRFLLLELDQAGVLRDDPPPALDGHPLLRTYREAAAQLRRYLDSEERAELVAEPPPAGVLGAPVSLDWFRFPSPQPNPLEKPFHWLAAGEAALRAAPLDPAAGGGSVFVRRGGAWWALEWRRDDGVTPALVSARPAG
jgi:hypothetical protein